MDLLQKSSKLIQRKKRARLMREDDYSNKIVDARNVYLKSKNVAPDEYAEQELFLKEVKKHFFNLCQWPIFLRREFVRVEILSAVSPKELFVLKKYDEDKVNDFHYEFAEEYTNNAHQLVYCLKVGIICAAKTSKGWQRCRILKLHDKNTCDALLFDIGRKERVNWNDLRMLNGKWIDIKPLASRCSLVSVNSAHSIDRFTLQQQQAFTEILQTQSEFYVFVNRPDVISSDVFLYYKCDNHFYCVNEVFPSESSTDDSSVDETETSMRVGIRTPAAEMSSQPKEIFHIGRFETTSSMPQSEQQFVQKTTKEISHVGRFETTLLMPQSEQQKIEQNIELKIEQNNQQIEQQNGNSIGNGKEPSHELRNEKVDQNGVVKHANGHTNVSEVEVEDQEDESQYSVPQLDRLLSKPEPVVVKHIEGINEIHICFEKYLSGLSRLRFDIQKYVQHISTAKAEPQQNWKVGDSCLVFDSFDGYSEWLRGTIVSINGLEKCGVYLRDVGKTIESPVNNLKPINDDLHRVRDFTWKMKLSYIKMEKGCPLETANELLYDLVCSYDKVAISALHENDNKDWGIILWGIKRGSQVLLPERFTYVNINEELVKNKVATTRVQFDGINHLINDLVNKKPLEYEESEDIQKTTQNYEVTDEIMEVKQWLPSDPIFKREFAAFPMYVSQNCILTVLEANRKTTAEELQSILDMKGQAKELVRRDSLEWKKEDACFARFNGDKKFYRATVRRVNFERNSCVVRFIDYGNCETCSLDDLRIANMFGDIPVLARLYQLENIKPLNDDGRWPEYVRNFCSSMVVDKQTNLVLTEMASGSKAPNDPDLCKLEIFTKDKDLGTALVSRGFAEWIHPVDD